MTITITDSRPASGPASPNPISPDAFNSPAAILGSKPIEASPQGASLPGPAAVPPSTPTFATLLDPALSFAADILDDLERVRIANENRLRQLTRVGEDSDGEERGFGLDVGHPDVLRMTNLVGMLAKVEHDAALNLQRKMRKHPLGPWMKAQRGIGEKQGARLLAAIGDPYINSAKDAPRTVSALWAYCGLHVLPGGQEWVDDHVAAAAAAAGDQHRDTDHLMSNDQVRSVGVAAKRRKGERANWSSSAKMRAYLVAESCMKTGKCTDCRGGQKDADTHFASAAPACTCSPYRVTYDKRRAHTATTHPDWTDGHSHNDALRIVSKEILKQMWRAARDWHLSQESARSFGGGQA